ncbi:MAG TPA: DUF58 domain-containing protein [Acidimicrobiales bacterium]|nr:DUF58 domain-containing protein [Acidimicrobiales bacterium]
MPVAASAAALGIWGAVAHDSGAGWVQAIGTLVAGTLVVGMFAPAVAVMRVRCRIAAPVRHASAGSPVSIEFLASAPVEVEPLDPPGPPTMVRAGGGRTTVEIRPAHRGLLDHCTVIVASAAPFGILWWTRSVTLALPRPLLVAPRVGSEEVTPGVARPRVEGPLAAPGRSTEPRGVRPYERGDRRALVHWPASAHTGSLMVRATERQAPHAAVVDGRLPSDPEAAERHAERVMATVRAHLLAGARVELETIEPQGAVTAPVVSLSDAGARLALALPRVR